MIDHHLGKVHLPGGRRREMSKKITMSNLEQMLADQDVTDEEVRPYLIEDLENSEAFRPRSSFLGRINMFSSAVQTLR